MGEPKAKTTIPPPPKKTLSGTHPAVTAYRAKLESIAEHDEAARAELDELLKEFVDAPG